MVAPPTLRSQAASDHQVRFISSTFSADDNYASALHLIGQLRPDWLDDPSQVRFTRFTDGITNTLLKAHRIPSSLKPSDLDPDQEAILLRAYGNGTDVLIDRQRETQNHELLSRYALAPELLARFENGMLYRFIPGKPTGPDDLSRPQIYLAVARRLAQWHALVPCIPGPAGYGLPAPRSGSKNPGEAPTDDSLPRRTMDLISPSKPSPNVWTVIQKWILALPTKTDEQKQQQANLQKELKELVAEFSQREGLGKDGLVFAHCDLLSGNIIVLPSERSKSTSDRDEDNHAEGGRSAVRDTSLRNHHTNDDVETVSFIDYEYATPSPAAFDIANHFAEWVGFDCDYSKLPTVSQRRAFVNEYIRTYFELTSDQLPSQANSKPSEALACEAQRLFDEVDLFRGLPGFYWGIWALIQATISEIDFDYSSYAKLRLGEYWAWRDEVKGTRQAEGRELPLREKRWAEA